MCGDFRIFASEKQLNTMTYFSFIILLVVVCTIAAILDHVSGMDKPKKKPYKPKKFRSNGRNSTTYPGYTSYY